MQLNQEEKDFMDYWSQHRDHEAKFSTRLMKGLPTGLRFALVIALFTIAARVTGLHKQMTFITTGAMIMILLAVLGIVLFYAVFTRTHRWDMNEQQYQSLKARQAAQDAENAGT
jgi:membrane protein YdbS with pleckstrin-like domain